LGNCLRNAKVIRNRECGQALVEYTVLVLLIAATAAASVRFLGGTLEGAYTGVDAEIEGIAGATVAIADAGRPVIDHREET